MGLMPYHQVYGRRRPFLYEFKLFKEVAHANNANDYDSNFWQVIKPEMNRYDKTGAGTIYRAKIIQYGQKLEM